MRYKNTTPIFSYANYTVLRKQISALHTFIVLLTTKLIIQNYFSRRTLFFREDVTFITHSLMVKNQLYIIQVGTHLPIFFLFYLLTPT